MTTSIISEPVFEPNIHLILVPIDTPENAWLDERAQLLICFASLLSLHYSLTQGNCRICRRRVMGKWNYGIL